MLHLSMATHYCQGRVEALKFTFDGKPAVCGMEDEEEDLPFTGTQINSHCCDNVVTTLGIDNNYTPSFSAFPDFCQHILQVFIIPSGLPVNSLAYLKSLYTNESPPGSLMSTNVDLSIICVYRI